jgi:hypothetical protein
VEAEEESVQKKVYQRRRGKAAVSLAGTFTWDEGGHGHWSARGHPASAHPEYFPLYPAWQLDSKSIQKSSQETLGMHSYQDYPSNRSTAPKASTGDKAIAQKS